MTMYVYKDYSAINFVTLLEFSSSSSCPDWFAISSERKASDTDSYSAQLIF